MKIIIPVLLLVMIYHSSLSQEKKSLSIPVTVHNDSSPFKPAPVTLQENENKEMNNWNQELLFFGLPQLESDRPLPGAETSRFNISGQPQLIWSDEVKYYPSNATRQMRHNSLNGHIVTTEVEPLDDFESGTTSSSSQQPDADVVELKKQYDRMLLLDQPVRGKTERFMIMDGNSLKYQPIDINQRTLFMIKND